MESQNFHPEAMHSNETTPSEIVVDVSNPPETIQVNALNPFGPPPLPVNPVPPPLPKRKQVYCGEMTKKVKIAIAAVVFIAIAIATALVILFMVIPRSGDPITTVPPTFDTPASRHPPLPRQSQHGNYGYQPASHGNHRNGAQQYQQYYWQGNPQTFAQPANPTPPRVQIKVYPTESELSFTLFRDFDMTSNGGNDQIVFHVPGLMTGDIREQDAQQRVKLTNDEQREFTSGWNNLKAQFWHNTREEYSDELKEFISRVYVRWLKENPESRSMVVGQITREELTELWKDTEFEGDPICSLGAEDSSRDRFRKGERFVSLCGQKNHLFSERADKPTPLLLCPICRGNQTRVEWVLMD